MGVSWAVRESWLKVECKREVNMLLVNVVLSLERLGCRPHPPNQNMFFGRGIRKQNKQRKGKGKGRKKARRTGARTERNAEQEQSEAGLDC